MRVLIFILALNLAACATKPVTEETQSKTTPVATIQGTPAPITKSEIPEKKEEPKAVPGELTCKFGEHVRNVRVDKPDQSSCEVIYTKDEQSNSVASAKSDLSHCDKVRDQIKSNLTAYGYTCQ